MSIQKDYLTINKASWNNRTETHLHSEFYDVKGFIQGNSSLNDIELAMLGAIKGKSILHLQCHFGQDSISLQRLGATVVGVDLSDKAIENAVQLAKETNAAATFICCDIYELPKYLDQQFDIVFTSYGTITWLPDLTKWAEIISHFLKPNGKFIFVEFHPVMWMFDDKIEKIGYPYFNEHPICETETGTYADKTASITQSYVTWNHSLSEVIQSLIDKKLMITAFEEYDYSPYNVFHNMKEVAPKQYKIQHIEHNIPLVYSIIAIKSSIDENLAKD